MNIKNNQLQEGKDYEINEEGFLVWTREYLMKRGVCCHSGCRNCPYQEEETNSV